MKDTLETNLPEEAGKLEETKKPVETPEIDATADVEANDTAEADAAIAAGKLTKEEILAKLTELVETSVETSRGEVEALKQAYYKIRRNEVEELKKVFIADGGEEKDFTAPADETENKIKDLLTSYKEKRAAILAEEERVKAANYALKLQLIDQLKELCESQDDFNKLYNSFKDIQQRWKEVKAVPQEHVNELWKNYQIYTEKFYDIIKINNQFRDYDFKKNLELKTALCETVEKLGNEPDVISAFHQLQKLHQEFREIGPVAKDLRESVWERFKSASTQINKRHQEYYEKIKAREEENLVKKTALCEKVEGFELDKLKSFADWDKVTKEIIAIQAEWKTIGFTPKNMNAKIFERFRKACDAFFKQKSEHFKELKSALSENYAKKMELCEKAESLKDNTDWNPTTNIFIALQKEWKTIGAVPKKYSDAVWKRFSDACNAFFAARDKATSSQRAEENENLEKKRSIVERLKAITADAKQEGEAQLRSLMEEWQSVGHIPYKYKDKLYKAYREQVDRLCKELDVRRISHRAENLKAKVTAAISRGGDAMLRERDRLFRAYEAKRNEIKTYENNLGFLNAASKSGNSLLDEMKRRMESLKAELEDIRKSIEDIDAKAKEPAGNETTEQAKETAGTETAGQPVEDSAAKAEKETEKPADNPGDTAADK